MTWRRKPGMDIEGMETWKTRKTVINKIKVVNVEVNRSVFL